MVDSLSDQSVIILQQKSTLQADYEHLLQLERGNSADLRQKFNLQKQETQSHAEENKHLKKKVRSRTWQRNGAAVIAIAVIVLSLVP